MSFEYSLRKLLSTIPLYLILMKVQSQTLDSASEYYALRAKEIYTTAKHEAWDGDKTREMLNNPAMFDKYVHNKRQSSSSSYMKSY